MTALKESVSGFSTPTYPKTPRTPESFAAKTVVAQAELAHLQARYANLSPLDDRRLLRDSIDHWLRRFQGYAVEGDIGAHYTTASALNANSKVFEHVIPLSRGRDMLIGNILQPIQAMYIPTCFVTLDQNKLLSSSGLGSHSNDYWLFFSRYDGLNDEITTHDGVVINPKVWTLADHFNYFGIKHQQF